MKTSQLIAISVAAIVLPLSAAHACGGGIPGVSTTACHDGPGDGVALIPTPVSGAVNAALTQQSMNQVTALTHASVAQVASSQAITVSAIQTETAMGKLSPSAGGALSCETTDGMITICGYKM